MLTMNNTEGFNQSELDIINKEVEELMNDFIFGYHDYDDYLQWAEEKILKMYGGA
jgi:hypothetical protein